MWKYDTVGTAEKQRVCQVLAADWVAALLLRRQVCVNYCAIGVSNAAEEPSFIQEIAARLILERRWATRLCATAATKTGEQSVCAMARET
jgi:hypothetical protein